MKSKLILVLINIIIFFVLETLAFLILKSPIFDSKISNITTADGFRKFRDKTDYFCDSMHTFENLQKEMAELIFSKLPEKKAILWFFGGSTTKAPTCGVINNYPEYLGEFNLNLVINNQADQALTSDHMIERLEKKIREEKLKPDFVFWASWINDLFIIKDGFNANSSIIKEKYPEFSNIIDPTNSYKLASISKTLYHNINLYKLLFKIFSPKQIYGLEYDREELIKSNRYIEAVLLNYKTNLERLRKIQIQYGFKVYFIQPPYLDVLFDEIGTHTLKWKKIDNDVIKYYLNQIDLMRTSYENATFINFKEIFKGKFGV